jgi:hypothetical protein
MVRAHLMLGPLALLLSPWLAASSSSVSLKERPVSKVITILKDMLKTMEKEQEEDEAIYDKLACWCETNDKEKTKAIKEAEARIATLESSIVEHTAASARLSTEIKNTEQEVAKNQLALDKATAIREKELAAFNEEEKEMLQAVSALKQAITVLSKHHSGAFLQVPRTHLLSVAATLQHLTEEHAELLRGVLSPSERRTVTSFVQSADKQGYAPQSGEIFGILEQMKETFEKDMSESQKEELANQKAYEELKAAKEAQVAAGQEQVNSKSQELADTDQRLANSKTDIEDTKNSLGADQRFLMELKERCSMTDSEWETRQKTRALEMEAVSKALAILSSDESHEVFTRTFNPALAQVRRSTGSLRREQASRMLARAAAKLHSPRLSNLATRVKLDAFERVKKAIDDMVASLLEEKAAEIKHKDFCVNGFSENQLQTEKKERAKQELLAQIDTLESTIKDLTDAIDSLKAEIAEMTVQLKHAGEDREKENQEFQATIADQRETQKVLASALEALKAFYGKQEALVQQGQEPPPGFGEYKKSAASGGVIALMQSIIADAKAMEDETVRSEEDAQKAYEDFVKETNLSIEAKSKDIVEKSEVKAKAESDLVETKEAKEAVMLELEQLSNYNAELHQSCDYILKNFDIRQTARAEEIEALRQAKAILSGAKFEEFLQSA